jgi:serine/threonine protein kinase
MFIISEYINGGSLYSYVKGLKGKQLEPKKLINLIKQLVSGLKYIHSQNVAHRDIKLENIMISTTGIIKYIDFGLSCTEKCRLSTCMDTCKGRPGTLLYEPPEFFNNKFTNNIEGAKAHDVWSLSMVLWELVHAHIGAFPYDVYDSNGKYLETNIIINNIIHSPSYSPAYKYDNNINSMLSYITVNDATKRPTIDDIHTYVNQNIL